MYTTITKIKQANKKAGGSFFDRGTMKFFNSKVESGVIKGKYFITSEKYEFFNPKRYTIRKITSTGSIDTIGNFCQFNSKRMASDYIKTKL